MLIHLLFFIVTILQFNSMVFNLSFCNSPSIVCYQLPIIYQKSILLGYWVLRLV